jgi:hypothetical protein
MKKELNFNEWAQLINDELKAYHEKQKEETRKKFEQYYR